MFVDAPVEQVSSMWTNWDNFPRFMSNVHSVVPLEGDRSHWKVCGPAGIDVEFDAVTLDRQLNSLSWESVPHSKVRSEGRITLVPEGDGTLATVRLSYQPAAGVLGPTISSLFGANPTQKFEDDLNRMKQFVERRRAAMPESA
jgi:uncharacterized membrane protein